jgi:hypothetical protein
MLTKAYIKALPENGNNVFKVRVPLYEDNTGQEAIFDALLCTDPSSYNGYSIGDAVYIQFEDEYLNTAVIMGKLYVDTPTESSSYNLVNELKVTDYASLPPTTKLGDYTAQDLVNLYNAASTVTSNTSSSTTKIVTEDSYDSFTIICSTWDEKQGKYVQDTSRWYTVTDEDKNPLYYIYTMAYSENLVPEERRKDGNFVIITKLVGLDGTETPVWDIAVDPFNTEVPYKTQIKYRAWCTTLNTYYGYMELISMNIPSHDITLEVKGLNLE